MYDLHISFSANSLATTFNVEERFLIFHMEKMLPNSSNLNEFKALQILIAVEQNAKIQTYKTLVVCSMFLLMHLI